MKRLAGITLAALIALAGCGSTTDSEPSRQLTGEMASRACQKLVKAQLKSPDSAKFQPGSKEATESGPKELKYTVRGTVEAGNSLGGSGLVDYECTVLVDWRSGPDAIGTTPTLDKISER